MADSDPLIALREQISAATDAAERLVREAEQRRSTPAAAPPQHEGPGIPAAGWEPARTEAADELQALARLLSSLRELLPAEIQEQVSALIKQLLVLLRSLIDWAVVQIESGRPGERHEIEDIPIG